MLALLNFRSMPIFFSCQFFFVILMRSFNLARGLLRLMWKPVVKIPYHTHALEKKLVIIFERGVKSVTLEKHIRNV